MSICSVRHRGLPLVLAMTTAVGCIDRPPVAPAPPVAALDAVRIEDLGAASVDVIVLLTDSTMPRTSSAERRSARRERATRMAREFGLSHRHVFSAFATGFSARVPAGRLDALRRDARVRRVEPVELRQPLLMDVRAPLSSLTNRAARHVARQTGVTPTWTDRIELDRTPFAWGVSVPLDIAIIDSGIDSLHPDLNVVGGYNVASESFAGVRPDSWNDRGGHGTAVAGMAGARADDVGATGTAPGARLWAVKITESDGSSVDAIIAALDWITARKQDFKAGLAGGIDFASANLSYGMLASTSSCAQATTAEEIAFCGVMQEGVSFVLAAGNSGVRWSAVTDVIGVSAMADFDGRAGSLASPTCGPLNEIDDTLADFSNYGTGVAIAAPGACVLTTAMGGGYSVVSGTSLAAPEVAGAVALYLFASQTPPAANIVQLRAINAAVIGAATPQNAPCGYLNEHSADGSREPLLFLNATEFGGTGSCDDGNVGPRDPTPRVGIFQVCLAFSGAVASSAPVIVYADKAPSLRQVYRLPRGDGSACIDAALPEGLTEGDLIRARLETPIGFFPYWTPLVNTGGTTTTGFTVPNNSATGVIGSNKGITIVFNAQPVGPLVPTVPSSHYRAPDYGFVELCVESATSSRTVAIGSTTGVTSIIATGTCKDSWLFSGTGPAVGRQELELMPERILGLRTDCRVERLAGVPGRVTQETCEDGRQRVYPDATSGYLVTYAQTDVGAGFLQLAPGRRHSCGIDRASAPFCWGNAENGKVGSGGGSTFPERTPWGVYGLWRLTTLAVGDEHACALDTRGQALCWGDNSAGQLGMPTFASSLRPVRPETRVPFSTLDAGGRNSCALSSAGEVYCWGTDARGTTRRVPTRLAAGGFIAVSVGSTHACVLDRFGSAYCWGENGAGQLGDGTTIARDTLVKVSGRARAMRFTAISAGDQRTCAIEQVTGQAWCWGKLAHGPSSGLLAVYPDSVPTSTRYSSISTGTDHDCALAIDRTAWCWGSNARGQLGTGTTTGSGTPSLVTGARSYLMIAAGSAHTCAIDLAGLAYCWGAGSDFRLGNGSDVDRMAPVLVAGQP